MKAWIGTIRYYLRQFIELGVLLLGVSVFAEILFGPDVAFFGSQVTTNLVALLNSLGESGIAALIVVLCCNNYVSKIIKIVNHLLNKLSTTRDLHRKINRLS